jgi:hypothetical protein
MTYSKLDPTPLEDVAAALSIAVLLVTSPLLRPLYSRWGLSAEEAAHPLPGDEIAPGANLVTTRAITIHAPASKVWPWLAQIGQEKGALYSFERLENLAKCQMKNAGRIVPEWQNTQVGDNVRLGPKGYPLFRIVGMQPGRALLMQACDPVKEQPGPASWCLILEEVDAHTTRLWTRNRNRYEPTFGNSLMWRVIVDPIAFIMERQMLIGIKRRAEIC